MRLNYVSSKIIQAEINVHKKQLLTYLRIGKKPLGLLINFNQLLLKDGITRIINPSVAEMRAITPAVIPAKAGIHARPKKMDSRLRGNDRRS